MAIAGYVTGARKGLIYLRGEYTYLPRAARSSSSPKCGANSLLGMRICGAQALPSTSPSIMGAGAYICGEETALIESLEGKPGQAAHQTALPRHLRLSGPADGREQCRDPVQGHRGRDTAAASPMPARAPSNRPARRSFRCPAMASVPAFTNIRSACASRRCWRSAARENAFAVQICGAAGKCLAPRGIRAAHRLRGRADRGRVHGVRQRARPVRDRAELREFLRARNLRLLHARAASARR